MLFTSLHSGFVWGERAAQAVLIGISVIIVIISMIVLANGHMTAGMILLFLGGVGGAISYWWLENPMSNPAKVFARETANILGLRRGQGEIEDYPVVPVEGGDPLCPGRSDGCGCLGSDEGESWTAELEEADEKEIECAYRDMKTGSHEEEILSELRSLADLIKSEIDDEKVASLENAIQEAHRKSSQSFDDIIKLLDEEHDSLSKAIAACTADTQKKICEVLGRLKDLSKLASDKGSEVESRLQKLLDSVSS